MVSKYNILTNDVGIFHIYVFFPAGSIYENNKNSGCSHLLEHMLFKNKGTVSNIVKSITEIGGRYNAATYKDCTYYFIKTHKSQYKKAIEYIFQITMNNNFTEDDLKIERQVVIEEYNQTVDNFHSKFLKFGMSSIVKDNNKYAKSVIGRLNILKNITAKDLKKYYKEHYTQPIIVMNCDNSILNKAIKYLKTTFGKDMEYDFTNDKLIKESLVVEPKLIFVNEPYAQYTTRLTFVTFPAHMKYDNLILKFIYYILTGAGLYSLLSHQVRDLRGLVYTINSYIELFRYCGLYIIQFGSSSPKTDYIISLVLNILSKLKKEGLSESKFKYFKNSYLNQLKTLFSNQDTRTEMNGLNFFYGIGIKENEYITAVEKISNDDIIRVARLALNFSKMGIISVGSYSSVEQMTKRVEDIVLSYH